MHSTHRMMIASIALIAAGAQAAPVKKADASGDVTRAQMQAQVNQVFDMADTDRDNFMSRKEFGARMGAVLNRTPPGTPGAPTKAEAQKILLAADAAFKAVDKNGDGKLSRAEAAARPLAAFDAMDTNHDGVLTMPEKMAAHQADAARPTTDGKAGPKR